MIKTLRIALLTCAVATFSASAHAASISIESGYSGHLDVLWSKTVGTTDLIAIAGFDISVTDDYADFKVTITNNTVASAGEAVHSIGFNSDPNGDSISNVVAGKYFQSLGLNQKFPSYKTVDICAWASNNCTGGAQGSNLPGGGAPVGTDSFAFRLNGDFAEGLALNNFVIKFQGELGSFEFSDTSRPPTSAPEPSSLLLLITGVAATVFGARRKAAR